MAISESTAILNVVNGDSDTVAVRRAIIQRPRARDCKFAHIPGISQEIIAVIARSPMQEILVSCELVAWALGEANKAELESYDSVGKTYSLQVDLGGWENEPIMSPGVIFPGTWGNIPPGETFCCPDPTAVFGRICINGSVPGLLIQPGEEIILHFDRGRLVDWTGKQDSPGHRFFEAHELKR